jgi:hypothetical protein
MMTLRNLFILNAIVALGFAIGFLVIPGTMWELYGVTPGPGVNLAGQFFAVELIAVGLLSWLVRNVSDTAALKAITLALLVADVIGLVVSFIGIFGGVFNAMGWSAVVIYLGLSLGYAYFRFLQGVES